MLSVEDFAEEEKDLAQVNQATKDRPSEVKKLAGHRPALKVGGRRISRPARHYREGTATEEIATPPESIFSSRFYGMLDSAKSFLGFGERSVDFDSLSGNTTATNRPLLRGSNSKAEDHLKRPAEKATITLDGHQGFEVRSSIPQHLKDSVTSPTATLIAVAAVGAVSSLIRACKRASRSAKKPEAKAVKETENSKEK